MALPKLSEDHLIPLTTLKTRVDQFSDLCFPDFIYLNDETKGLTFEVLPCPDTDDGSRCTGLIINDDKLGALPYYLSDWARSQLYSHLGARKKWFNSVSYETQAHELNERRHTLHGRMFRTMRPVETNEVAPFRIVRGLVSSTYGDIPDGIIMDTFLALLPGAQVLRYHSGRTDRAFYAHLITGEAAALPGATLQVYPGLSVKNSEVGYSSLWLTPTFYVPRYGTPVIFEKECLLRRTHRGEMADMVQAFQTALSELAAFWHGLPERLAALADRIFSDEDTAVARMRQLVDRVGGSKLFAYRAEQHYRAMKHQVHSGDTIYESILAHAGRAEDKDEGYNRAAIAGAVLLHLLP